jgi:hypothetical protein
MGFDPRLQWILSSDLKMPSLPPCDDPTSSNNAGIHAIGSAIMILMGRKVMLTIVLNLKEYYPLKSFIFNLSVT